MRPKFLVPGLAAIAAACSIVVVTAQTTSTSKPPPAPPKKPLYGTMHFETTLGSFKILPFDRDKDKAEGRLEISFSGTVLISGLDGRVTPSANVRKEYSNTQRQKLVYHGKNASIVVEGKWLGLQFFGQDLKGIYNGHGIMRMAGEFDKNLNTGIYWYEGGKHLDWGTGGQQHSVPEISYLPPAPKIEDITGKKG